MEKIEEINYKEILRLDLDFAKLAKWKDESGVPVCSFITFYRVIGLIDAIKEHNPDGQISALDNLAVNVETHRKIKRLIENSWECYDIDVDADNHIIWKADSKYGKRKHYAKKLSGRRQGLVGFDFANYCPSIDPSLPNDVIIYRVFGEQENA